MLCCEKLINSNSLNPSELIHANKHSHDEIDIERSTEQSATAKDSQEQVLITVKKKHGCCTGIFHA